MPEVQHRRVGARPAAPRPAGSAAERLRSSSSPLSSKRRSKPLTRSKSDRTCRDRIRTPRTGSSELRLVGATATTIRREEQEPGRPCLPIRPRAPAAPRAVRAADQRQTGSRSPSTRPDRPRLRRSRLLARNQPGRTPRCGAREERRTRNRVAVEKDDVPPRRGQGPEVQIRDFRQSCPAPCQTRMRDRNGPRARQRATTAAASRRTLVIRRRRPRSRRRVDLRGRGAARRAQQAELGTSSDADRRFAHQRTVDEEPNTPRPRDLTFPSRAAGRPTAEPDSTLFRRPLEQRTQDAVQLSRARSLRRVALGRIPNVKGDGIVGARVRMKLRRPDRADPDVDA